MMILSFKAAYVKSSHTPHAMCGGGLRSRSADFLVVILLPTDRTKQILKPIDVNAITMYRQITHWIPDLFRPVALTWQFEAPRIRRGDGLH